MVTIFWGEDFAFKAKFERTSPAGFAEKVGIPLGWIVVHYSHIPSKADRRIAHGQWFELKSDRGTIYRILRFSPQVRKGRRNSSKKIAEERPAKIVIDWIGWIDLHSRDEDVGGAIELQIRRVPLLKRPWAYLRHPDPAVRLSGMLGWASVILGLIALILSIPYCWIGEHVGSVGPPIAGSCGA